MHSLPELNPPPKRCCVSGGVFVVGAVPCRLTCFTDPDEAVRCLRLLENSVGRGSTRVLRPLPENGVHTLELQTVTKGTLPRPAFPLHSEGYAIAVRTEGIVLTAASALGLYRGCATLAQLLQAASESGTVPCCDIDDLPDRSVRGLMLDVSRNRIYSLKTLFGVVDGLARLKMNRLELYFENVFAYRSHPAVWVNTSPYTGADMEALSAYAAERHVTLVPNQNTLGHFERWFREDPSLLDLAELPEGGACTPWGSVQKEPTGLAAGLPETVAFAQGLLDELLPHFPTSLLAHIGGDEVFDLGQGRSRTDDKAGLYLRYMQAMADTVRKHGKTPVLWADMLLRHPDALARATEALPDAQWVLWGYEATDPLPAQAEQLRAAGLRFVVAPGSSSWRSFCGRTDNMVENIRTAAAVDSDGLILCDWGDAGHWQPLSITLPSLVLTASLAWNTASDTGTDSVGAAVDTLCGLSGAGRILLNLGNTYLTAQAPAGNATRLFQAYNLPLAQTPDFDRGALNAALSDLLGLLDEAETLGNSLTAREIRFAAMMQILAVWRALGRSGLRRVRASLAAQLELLWLERGPRANLDRSLADFLAPKFSE